MKTDPAANTRKWILFPDQLPRLPKFPFSHQNHKAFDIISGWADFIAGRGFNGILGLEISPRPSLIPEHRPQGDGDRRDILETSKSNLLFH